MQNAYRISFNKSVISNALYIKKLSLAFDITRIMNKINKLAVVQSAR